MRKLSRRHWIVGSLGLAASGVGLLWLRFPSDKTPEGAYLRVTIAVNRGNPRDIFPYLETTAQHAAFTIHTYFTKARERILAAYPEAEREAALQRLPLLENVEAGPGVFAWYAEREGWIARLRRDLSAVKHVVQDGERATVETSRGTHYPFRRRENGIWGLTLFTAKLAQDAEKLARDFSVIEEAARDYEQANGIRTKDHGQN